MQEKFVLASASPRRRELLNMIGIKNFIIIPATHEEPYPRGMSEGDAVEYISMKKAESSAEKADADSVILAADTVVSLDGHILEKPSDAEDARRMLRSLSGRKHTVYTGVAVIKGSVRRCAHSATHVWFKPLSDAEIDAYIATGQPLDKAGAYGAQDMAALFVERVEGEFWNVVGLPVCHLGKLLSEMGVSVI